jgi:hypothetical protein
MKNLAMILTLISTPILASAASGCDDQNMHEDAEAERGMGAAKADAFGTCAPSDCGGKSSQSACYCDEECIDFGDCCSDVATMCEWELPPQCPHTFIPMPDCEFGNPTAVFEGECLVNWQCPTPPQCPQVFIPPPECDFGEPTPVFSGECHTGWDCPPPSDCPQVFIPPPECESGDPIAVFSGECHTGWECPAP